MIAADRREGGLLGVDARRSIGPFRRSLDRNLPLGFKLILPVIAVTLGGAFVFGVVLAENTRRDLDATYTASADASGQAASKAFHSTISDPTKVDTYLADVASAQPNVQGIWIVNVVLPGQPAVASSIPSDLGRTGLIGETEVIDVLAGRTGDEIHVVKGHDRLETITPVEGNVFAVIIWTSLDQENQVVAKTEGLVVVIALVICLLEVGALAVVLEFGVLRRVRRIGEVVNSFGRGSGRTWLSEGAEPGGRDALFNLARNVDHKLRELSERERAGAVVNELGLLALQGTQPADLTRKALDLTRQAADLERCFLVPRGGSSAIVDSYEGAGVKTAKDKLPIWVVSLVRSAILARRPILADSHGHDGRYWASNLEPQGEATAAFVPLAGSPDPLGVIVAIARPGGHISSASLSLIEAVATALGESLQRSEAQQARQESDAKSRALTTVSHEMRNPLSAMIGFSDLLLAGAAGPLNERQERYERRVNDASHHLLRLVNEYLDLARVMKGSFPLRLEPVVVAAEVRSVVELLQATADAEQVILHTEVPETAVAVADRMRLRQVLVNLISNAIRFTPARGHVRVEVAGGTNGVRISVIDTGVGIPADRQHLVFTEFAQLRPDDKGGGAGLGLALSKRFVEAMGGFIRFTSAEGEGTIFDLWLPGEQSPQVISGRRADADAQAAPAAPNDS